MSVFKINNSLKTNINTLLVKNNSNKVSKRNGNNISIISNYAELRPFFVSNLSEWTITFSHFGRNLLDMFAPAVIFALGSNIDKEILIPPNPNNPFELLPAIPPGHECVPGLRAISNDFADVAYGICMNCAYDGFGIGRIIPYEEVCTGCTPAFDSFNKIWFSYFYNFSPYTAGTCYECIPDPSEPAGRRFELREDPECLANVCEYCVNQMYVFDPSVKEISTIETNYQLGLNADSCSVGHECVNGTCIPDNEYEMSCWTQIGVQDEYGFVNPCDSNIQLGCWIQESGVWIINPNAECLDGLCADIDDPAPI